MGGAFQSPAQAQQPLIQNLASLNQHSQGRVLLCPWMARLSPQCWYPGPS